MAGVWLLAAHQSENWYIPLLQLVRAPPANPRVRSPQHVLVQVRWCFGVGSQSR